MVLSVYPKYYPVTIKKNKKQKWVNSNLKASSSTRVSFTASNSQFPGCLIPWCGGDERLRQVWMSEDGSEWWMYGKCYFELSECFFSTFVPLQSLRTFFQEGSDWGGDIAEPLNELPRKLGKIQEISSSFQSWVWATLSWQSLLSMDTATWIMTYHRKEILDPWNSNFSPLT